MTDGIGIDKGGVLWDVMPGRAEVVLALEGSPSIISLIATLFAPAKDTLLPLDFVSSVGGLM